MKYLRRLIWYLATRLVVLCCVLGAMTIAFYYAMNATNAYIILKDGMAKRAQVIMMDADDSTLTDYFTKAYLERDRDYLIAKEGMSAYTDYNVTGFDHRLTMTWMWCWPWEDTARAQIQERIPAIDGKVKASAKAANAALTASPPAWPSATYNVILSRENGRWRVRSITLVSVDSGV